MAHINLQLLMIALVTLTAIPSEAGPITIRNISDTQSLFETDVDGSVGLLNQTHTLVDIPGTPWESFSTIFEDSGFLADSITVNWSIRHLDGPHDEDIDPNVGVDLPPLTFTATAAGPFFANLPLVTILHPTAPGTIDAPHIDDFFLSMLGTVTTLSLPTPVPGRLAITDYTMASSGRSTRRAEPCIGFRRMSAPVRLQCLIPQRPPNWGR